MAIYIKGVELPIKENSYTVITVYNDGDVFVRVTEKGETIRKYFTDAVGIHEPHGRLIDADKVGWAKYNPDAGYLTQYQQGWNDGVDRTLREIDGTPTIIEGSE